MPDEPEALGLLALMLLTEACRPRLNRAIALAEVNGPQAGLTELEPLGADLACYHAFHVAQADLLRPAGFPDAAATAYQRALDLATNPAERAFLQTRLAIVLDGIGSGEDLC